MIRASRHALLATAMAVMVTWLAAACSGSSAGSRAGYSPSPASQTGASAWLLTRAALAALIVDPTVRARLQGARIYEILQQGQQPLPGVTADPVVTFASAAALEQAITGGHIPSGTYGVLYDPEAWSFTPQGEQRDPVQAAARAAAMAHAHGLRLLVAPALNLGTVLAPGSQRPRWRVFLDLGILGPLARVADVVELQAQSLERDTATYTAFVQAGVEQARGSNPGVTVLAGLSTNPPGAQVTGDHLTSAIQATRSLVDGYWLNIPGQGARCPTCNAPRPDLAIQALKQVGLSSRPPAPLRPGAPATKLIMLDWFSNSKECVRKPIQHDPNEKQAAIA